MILLPSILNFDRFCHSSLMLLPSLEPYSMILLMRLKSSLLALKTKPLLISSVVMIFYSLYVSLPLLKMRCRASSVLSNYFSMALVFSGLSCSSLQSLVKYAYTLMRMSFARSKFLLISVGLLKIYDRTVYRSCFIVLIYEN